MPIALPLPSERNNEIAIGIQRSPPCGESLRPPSCLLQHSEMSLGMLYEESVGIDDLAGR